MPECLDAWMSGGLVASGRNPAPTGPSAALDPSGSSPRSLHQASLDRSSVRSVIAIPTICIASLDPTAASSLCAVDCHPG